VAYVGIVGAPEGYDESGRTKYIQPLLATEKKYKKDKQVDDG